MNAVIFYVTDTFRLTGSTINAIEYFLAGVEHNPELKLFLLNGNKKFLKNIMKLMHERYILVGLNLSNIECIPSSKLVRKKFDVALVVDYMTISRTKGIINAKKLLVISEKHTESERFFYNKDKYNVEYYGEMPFHYRDHEYRMKCVFDRYRPLANVKEGTYLNSPRNPNPEEIDSSRFPQPVFFKSKTTPKENLFEQFTHYVYYHVGGWFDPHPRLFLECSFYNKTIEYINETDIKDGSWYRMEDLVHKGLWNRTLSKDDEIIGQLL